MRPEITTAGGPRSSGTGGDSTRIAHPRRRSSAVALPVKFQLHRPAAWCRDGGAGEKTREVDEVETVGEIRRLGLEREGVAIVLHETDAAGKVERKVRADALAVEVDAAQDPRVVLRW